MTIFVEDLLRSAMQEQALIALTCGIFVEDLLRSAMQEQALIAISCGIFA